MNGFRWDFNIDGILQYNTRINEANRASRGFLRGCVEELALRVFGKTVMRTPVDTGLLRRSWQIGEIVRVGDGLEVEIINPVEYAMYVEYGHRTKNHMGWVEGRFMLTLSLNEVERELPAILEAKMSRLVEGLGE